jgi:KipI family sensor histidine kinase inhibitor
VFDLLSRQCSVHDSTDSRAEVFREKRIEGSCENLIRVKPEDALCSCTPARDIAASSDGDEGVVGQIDDRPQKLFGLGMTIGGRHFSSIPCKGTRPCYTHYRSTSVARSERQDPDGEAAIVEFRPFGDAALLVLVRSSDYESNWRISQTIAGGIEDSRPDGVLGTIATYETVLVEFDPVDTTHDEVIQGIRPLCSSDGAPTPKDRKRVTVPVVYGGEHGPDLDSTAALMGVSPEELIESHCEPQLIRCVVSPAGSPMTDGLGLPGVPPRLAVPRASVPAGSVAIAGKQSMIYATSSPGGWRLIGRTPISLIDPRRTPPVTYEPGDLLCFRPIAADQWGDLEGGALEVSDD